MFTHIRQVEAFFEQRANYGIKPGLSRMYKMLAYVNNPHEKLKAIHIAGTNGKGSTLQFIKQGLIANGYQVGLFSSPSLFGLQGHIEINNQPITKDALVDRLNHLYPAIVDLDMAQNHPTEFEIMTVLAFDYFLHQVDIALIETGMGGREDTTNCLQPILSIITNIARDHTRFLGSDIKTIAHHKAGIIKHNIPVIVGEVDTIAADVIHKEVMRQQTTAAWLNQDFHYDGHTKEQLGERFTWSYSDHTHDVVLQMRGHHQVKNCSIAIMALTMLERNTVSLDWKQTLKALEKVTIPGRFERIQNQPAVILDGAHNLAGIQAFLQTVKTHYANVPKHLIFAAFKDKELGVMLSALEDVFPTITLTTFEHQRAANADDFLRLGIGTRHNLITDWHQALTQIKENDTYYFITGSLHFIHAARPIFKN